MNCLENDESDNLFLSFTKMYEELKGFSPSLERNELAEYIMRVNHTKGDQKITYLAQIR